MKKHVTVIVSSYNSLPVLKLAFESYRAQLPCSFVDMIVADDGSTDGTQEWLDALSDSELPFEFRYVTREHCGYGLASINNMAARRAQGSRLLFTNADVLHSRCSFLEHLDLPPLVIGAGVVHGIGLEGVKQVDKRLVGDWEGLWHLSKSYPTDASNLACIRDNPVPLCCWGGNFSVGKSVFDAVGGYCEDYHGKYGGEESDLVARIVNDHGGVIEWVKHSIGLHLDHVCAPYKVAAKGKQKFFEEN